MIRGGCGGCSLGTGEPNGNMSGAGNHEVGDVGPGSPVAGAGLAIAELAECRKGREDRREVGNEVGGGRSEDTVVRCVTKGRSGVDRAIVPVKDTGDGLARFGRPRHGDEEGPRGGQDPEVGAEGAVKAGRVVGRWGERGLRVEAVIDETRNDGGVMRF